MGLRDRAADELLPGTLDMLILKTVSRETMHGYTIAQSIQRVSREVLRVEEGALYPALHRLGRYLRSAAPRTRSPSSAHATWTMSWRFTWLCGRRITSRAGCCLIKPT